MKVLQRRAIAEKDRDKAKLKLERIMKRTKGQSYLSQKQRNDREELVRLREERLDRAYIGVLYAGLAFGPFSN